MSNKGFSHIGPSTHDLDKTRDFYVNVLGFRVVPCDVIKIKEGGTIRNMFIDVGHDQMLAPDCGMKYLPRETAFRKLQAMTAGVQLVRQALR